MPPRHHVRFPARKTSRDANYGTAHIKVELGDGLACPANPTRGNKSRVRPTDPCVDGDAIILPWNTVGRDLILSDAFTGETEFSVDDEGEPVEFEENELRRLRRHLLAEQSLLVA